MSSGVYRMSRSGPPIARVADDAGDLSTAPVRVEPVSSSRVVGDAVEDAQELDPALQGQVDVPLQGAGVGADAWAQSTGGEQGDGAPDLFRHRGMARLDDVHAHLGQQIGDGELDVDVEVHPGRLLSLAEGRVEDA